MTLGAEKEGAQKHAHGKAGYWYRRRRRRIFELLPQIWRRLQPQPILPAPVPLRRRAVQGQVLQNELRGGVPPPRPPAPTKAWYRDTTACTRVGSMLSASWGRISSCTPTSNVLSPDRGNTRYTTSRRV